VSGTIVSKKQVYTEVPAWLHYKTATTTVKEEKENIVARYKTATINVKEKKENAQSMNRTIAKFRCQRNEVSVQTFRSQLRKLRTHAQIFVSSSNEQHCQCIVYCIRTVSSFPYLTPPPIFLHMLLPGALVDLLRIFYLVHVGQPRQGAAEQPRSVRSLPSRQSI
jgi:hypothetical protein